LLALCGLAPGALSLGAKAARAEESTPLELSTGSPDALCPDLSMTREAVDRRLGTLVAPHGVGWKARYTIGHAPEGSPRDFVRLELFGPDGALQLTRDLPLEASCSTMADVIALVLDRHFRGLPEHERESVAAAAPVVVVPAREPPRLVASAAASVAPAPEPALLFLGVELSLRYPASPGAGLRWLGSSGEVFYWGVALSSAFLPDEQRLARGGRVELRGVSAQALAGVGPKIGPVRTFVGPSLRVTLDRGSARDLPEVDTRYRSVCGAGVQAGAIGPVSGRLYWTLTGSADWTLRAMSGEFVVDGREVLAPSPVQVWTAFGIGYSL
jgi:hypothetical protein